ncbi:MAG: hypothetical protein IN808_02725 [Rubrobacter sp.]|nr:hypothetical protein [Rubrobacter sp.]
MGVEIREHTEGRQTEGQQEYRRRGIGPWVRRNPWLLVRLFIVLVFSFGVSLIADQFSYGLEGKPVTLTAEQINSGNLPEGVEVGDYVRIRGTPDVGEDLTLEKLGTPESGIGISSRYSVSYFYFRLEETGDNLLIQTAQDLPGDSLRDLENMGERVWDGRLARVGTVIFHDTTQHGLKRADLSRDESIPVIETGDTPQQYRQIFPAYSAVIVVWLASLGWILWKRNKPFL